MVTYLPNPMSKPLVIVESPAKAKTLARFLGNQFRVEASVGHVRDLPENASEVPKEIKDKPWGRMGVDVDHGFKPYYVESADRKPRLRELKAAVKEAPEVLLATDPDREGESISWHLREVLKPKGAVKRIVFHEITEEAVRDAIAHARDIDLKLVEGPFQALGGRWEFHALDESACKVTLTLQFEPKVKLLGPAMAIGFQGLADRMVDDFVRVADRGGDA